MKPTMTRAAKSVRKDEPAASVKRLNGWQGSAEATQQRAANPVHLTPREREVLSLLCEGLPNKLIARRLKISSGTVKVHISRIFRALSVSNRLQAVVLARCWEFPGVAGNPQRSPHAQHTQHGNHGK